VVNVFYPITIAASCISAGQPRQQWRAAINRTGFQFFLSVFCEPFKLKLMPMDSQPHAQAVNITIRRQRHLDKQHGWGGLMALSRPRR
jgi:hypothetical protein